MALTKVGAGVLNIDDLYGFRNRIINGDMRIAQRGTTANPPVAGYNVVDRFRLTMGGTTINETSLVLTQSSDAPAGFTNSFLWTNTNAGSPLTGTQNALIEQRIEGNNFDDLGWGTAEAKAVTLSFWVKSSLTGNFGGSFVSGNNERSYPYIYSINSANTWEYKNVTIPGDTTGTWLSDTGTAVRVSFALGNGPDRLGPPGAWVSDNNLGATGQVQLVETAGATWQITGVQLEVGTVATPFERRPFGMELALCQRYFYKTYNTDVAVGTSTGVGMMYLETLADGTLSRLKSFNPRLPVTMRANPTVSAYSQTGTLDRISIYSNSASTLTVSSIADIGNNSLASYIQASTNAVAAQTYACHMTASAEL
jgi:hypothetical protein